MCFNKVLFSDFVVAWISSQLPKQKEGLFYTVFETLVIRLYYSSFYDLIVTARVNTASDDTEHVAARDNTEHQVGTTRITLPHESLRC